MSDRITFEAESASIQKITEYVAAVLAKAGINRKTVLKEKLRTEEIASKLIEHAGNGEAVTVSVWTLLGKYEIKLSCRGESFSLAELEKQYELLKGTDEEVNAVIGNIYSKIVGDNVRLKNKNGVNTVTYRTKGDPRSQLFLTLAGLVLGIGFGFLLKYFLPESVSAFAVDNVCATVSKLFLNAMKMIVAPLVFFSIAASVADFGDLKALGKIALKIFTCYLVTSVIAIAVGLLVYQLFPIGNTGLAATVDVSAASAVGTEMNVSAKDTILGIIPTDIITPFLESNMLQVIFVAMILGIAVSLLGHNAGVFKDVITSGNAVFSKITSMIVTFMPVAVFCSMAKMVFETDLSSLASAALWVPVCYAGEILMMAVYALLLLIFGRLNPLKFFKGFSPATLTAFSLGSSNATIPVSVKACERLGIDKRVYSFSIPFGATVNMDGNCITLIVSAMFMAKIFGITVTPSMLLALALSIMMLSVGAPGVPGGCLVCIAFLLPQIGVPAEAISIVMGLYSLAGMGLAACNVTGDAVVTVIVSRWEKMLDLKKYKSN